MKTGIKLFLTILIAEFAASDRSSFFKGSTPSGILLGSGLGENTWITACAEFLFNKHITQPAIVNMLVN